MSIVYVDIEVNQNNKVVDYGAYVDSNKSFHGSRNNFRLFIRGYDYICGHNIFQHDLKYIGKEVKYAGIKKAIDTLPLSALLLAYQPHHKLVKDYKLTRDQINDPYVDASLTERLFKDEIYRFNSFDTSLKDILYGLLSDTETFKYFFKYIKYSKRVRNLDTLIFERFQGLICANTDIKKLIKKHPEELAYCLTLINYTAKPITPPEWTVHQYKHFFDVLEELRGKPCFACSYCNEHFDTKLSLDKFFGYKSYRDFNGVNLQEQAVNAQVSGESIITVFPTAGGKSIAFQVPALIMGETVKGLTVVISPLQSLMQDQVKNLIEKDIDNVGTINGNISMLERKDVIERVMNGSINLLYISPESLRSKSIYRLLRSRNIVRFVIDEAHCFSTWGHDFRVDYLYIGEFIKLLLKNNIKNNQIPVSCFTATAKKEVIDDIEDYFKKTLDITMRVIKTNTRRKNLNFFVHDCENHQEKMMFIKDLLEAHPDKPVIIYTARRKSTEQVANELNQSGFPTNFYHGGLEQKKKIAQQLEFTNGEKNIIVATSAFGMGVDKDNVAFVIHYNISSTIEDYLQEAGRAGRDKSIDAECRILYDEKDVDKHFNLLNASKLSQNDINQVWLAIKRKTKKNKEIKISKKELARSAGWDIEEMSFDYVTKVSNCILALENVGYLKRKQNAARVYATSIKPKAMLDAVKQINQMDISNEERQKLTRVMSALYTSKIPTPNRGSQPVAMIEDLAFNLEYDKYEIIRLITFLKDKKILESEDDLLARSPFGYTRKKSQNSVTKYTQIMRILIEKFDDKVQTYNIKEINTEIKDRISFNETKAINRTLGFLQNQKIIKQKKKHNRNYKDINLLVDKSVAYDYIDMLADVGSFVIDMTYNMLENEKNENNTASYSVVSVRNAYLGNNSLLSKDISLKDTEKILLFLIKCGALIIDGGFLVVTNPMTIERVENNPLKQYTKQDYKIFLEYYNRKIKKIHILTQFVRTLSNHTEKGLELVDDYFNLSYPEYEKKYITKEFKKIMNRPMTKAKYDNLFKSLSPKQREIIDDDTDKNIVVLAGPGSGKTTLLASKLASLICLEDVKTDDLLMLTFSRAATVVFKEKLSKLIGGVANGVTIKTFHSFCFDVIGEVGNIDNSENIFNEAIIMIENNKAEESIINKSTLVIDEAQDMSEQEYELICSLIDYNEKMRVIAVGDDDQNIYEFRESKSKYLYDLSQDNCNVYELVTNFRSRKNLVEFTQGFTDNIKERYKSLPCESYTEENGNVRVYKHNSKFLYEPIVKQVKKMKLNKSIAILTQTNQEAEIMASMLIKEGIQSRVIQSNNNFKLINLYEMDYFINLFEDDTTEILNEMWKDCISKFQNEFNKSPLVSNLLMLLNGFDKLYPRRKYLIDLKSYLYESKLEHLYKVRKEIVTVSTIHKSKGKEFNTVFLMQTRNNLTQEDIRAIYVGLTRAESNLIVHTVSDIFDSLSDFEVVLDEYEEPNQLAIQLGYKDINLGGASYWQYPLKTIRTGSELNVNEEGILLNEKIKMYFSREMQENVYMKLISGYELVSAEASFKVKWYDKTKDKEFWIILPKIIFSKNIKE